MVELNTGGKIPRIGFGTYVGKIPVQTLLLEVKEAIEVGYRHIDCAYAYGTERRVGEILTQCFDEGLVTRKEMFITSKLWSSFHDESDVVTGCKETLSNLQLSYLDLYLIHWPVSIKKGHNFIVTPNEAKLGYSEHRIASCWRAMESLVEAGLVKAIGVSNFTIKKIDRLLKTARIVPAVNQVECHPYLQQKNLAEYCKSKGIVVEAYASLGQPSHPDRNLPVLLNDPVVNKIAHQHCSTPAQVLLAFALSQGYTALLKTTSKERMVENLKATDLVLHQESISELESIDKGLRYNPGTHVLKEGENPDTLWND